MSKSILIVDDEEDILDLLKFNLESEGFITSIAHDGVEAVNLSLTNNFDLTLLDVMMANLNGFDTCRKIRQITNYSKTPIFLTAKSEEIDQIIGLEIGADDYLHKPISPRILIAKIKAALRRQFDVGVNEDLMHKIVKVNSIEINRQNYTVKVKNETIFFPKKEFELLALLASNIGKVFRRDDLLNRIWGEQVNVGDRTVDVHISKVREKLKDLEYLLETVKGVGYRFIDS